MISVFKAFKVLSFTFLLGALSNCKTARPSGATEAQNSDSDFSSEEALGLVPFRLCEGPPCPLVHPQIKESMLIKGHSLEDFDHFDKTPPLADKQRAVLYVKNNTNFEKVGLIPVRGSQPQMYMSRTQTGSYRVFYKKSEKGDDDILVEAKALGGGGRRSVYRIGTKNNEYILKIPKDGDVEIGDAIVAEFDALKILNAQDPSRFPRAIELLKGPPIVSLASLAPGTDLTNLMQAGTLSRQDKDTIADELFAVFEKSAATNVFNGDIKPGNFNFDQRTGRISSFDWDTALFKENGPARDYVGTSGYKSPETTGNPEAVISYKAADAYSTSASILEVYTRKNPRDLFGEVFSIHQERFKSENPTFGTALKISAQNMSMGEKRFAGLSKSSAFSLENFERSPEFIPNLREYLKGNYPEIPEGHLEKILKYLNPDPNLRFE